MGVWCSCWSKQTKNSTQKELIGLNDGLFNLFGNIAGITIPPVIGYLVKRTGSYDDALIFVGASALLAIFSCVVIVGDIKRLELHSFPQIAAIYTAEKEWIVYWLHTSVPWVQLERGTMR